MQWVGLHHVQIGIPEGSEALAREFYAGVLGLTEVPKPPSLAVRGGLWFQLGDQQLHLGIEPRFRAMARPHPAFIVVGLMELRERIEGRGTRTIEDLPLPGFRRFYANDPFGNRLEFLEPESH